MNVLVIGKPQYNVVLPLEYFPVENSKNKILEKQEITGSTSVYVACMLAKWGIKVYYVGAVSGDEIGNKIRNEIESYNIDTKYMEIDYERRSRVNYVLLNKANGTSTEILHDNDTFLKKYKYDILPDYIITDGTDMGASIAAINNYPKAKIILLAKNISNEYLSLSKQSSYVCASMDFAKALTKLDFEFNKPKSLVALYQKIKDLNRAEYMVMLHDKGVLYAKDRQVKMIPGIPIEKKENDANSGAAFFGAFCYGILNGYDADTIAKTANIAAGLSLTKSGGIDAIIDKVEVFTTAGLDEEKIKAALNQNLTANEIKTESVVQNTLVTANNEQVLQNNVEPLPQPVDQNTAEIVDTNMPKVSDAMPKATETVQVQSAEVKMPQMSQNNNNNNQAEGTITNANG